jgi:hypothetical protein
MSNITHEAAPAQFVQAGDIRFAYRRFGPRGGTPLLRSIILPRTWIAGTRR